VNSRRLTFSLCAALLVADGAAAADAPRFIAQLTIRVDRVPEPGTLRVVLHDEASFSGSVGLMSRTTSARNGEASVNFARVPPGLYAVRAFLDRDGNGRRDPGEPEGMTAGTGASGFEAVAVALVPGANETLIHLAP
jgi:uncharacterized protein (DUF2141 family)